jgi:two-component system sensor kinase FixL
MIPLMNREVERISSLGERGVTGPASDREFDEVAQLAADMLDAPVGLVTMVGLDELWTYGCAGREPFSMPRSTSFCSHTIVAGEPLVVDDLSADPRFAHFPVVAGPAHLRFYAGAPILTGDGLALGTVCVVDTEPRKGVSDRQRTALGRLARVVGTMMDQRRLRLDAEARVKKGRGLAHRALHLSGITLFRASSSGSIRSLQLPSPLLAGLARQRLGGMSYLNAVHSDDIEELMRTWRLAVTLSLPFAAEFRLRDGNAGWRWFSARAVLDHRSGKAGDWFGILEDIEQRRRNADRVEQLEAEVNHLSRITAMGTMASTLAHELNQPLTAMANYVRAGQRMLASGGAGTPPLAEALEGAAEAALRAGGIVRSVRELVARGDVQRRRVEVEPLMREAHRIAMADCPGEHPEVAFDCDRAVATIKVDPLQIQQVIVNLIRNAAQAMERAPVRRLSIAVRAMPDQRCEIAVGDTGPGLDRAVAAKLFSPFNTSKNDGMGIGLSISRTIVEAHGGQIAAAPNADGGMRFSFTLPTC